HRPGETAPAEAVRARPGRGGDAQPDPQAPEARGGAAQGAGDSAPGGPGPRAARPGRRRRRADQAGAAQGDAAAEAGARHRPGAGPDAPGDERVDLWPGGKPAGVAGAADRPGGETSAGVAGLRTASLTCLFFPLLRATPAGANPARREAGPAPASPA